MTFCYHCNISQWNIKSLLKAGGNEMSYNEFLYELATIVKKMLQRKYNLKDVTVIPETLLRNNDVKCEELMVTFSSKSQRNICCNISGSYTEYTSGKSIVSIAESVLQQIDNTLNTQMFALPDFRDFESIKENIIVQLVNLEKNKNRLSKAIYLTYLDFAVIFRYVIDTTNEGIASTVINSAFFNEWGVSIAELYEIALNNTVRLFPFSYCSLFEKLMKLLPESEISEEVFEPDYMLYILTNNIESYGASTILYPDLLKTLAEEHYSDIIILPSSIHEVLLCFIDVDDYSSYDDLQDIVKQANKSAVSLIDFLSDNVYRYSMETDEITIISE